MTPNALKIRKLGEEFMFLTSRSGGPGGQNVNKVSTKVELRFNISGSTLLSEEEKGLILKKLKNKINKESELILVSQSERTQFLNKQNVIEKFYELVSKALTIPIKRRATRPTLSSKLKRVETKKLRGQVKMTRRKFDPE
jgi:ribosome-associated protein